MNFKAIATIVLAAAGVVHAHAGPRVFLGNEAGKVTTYLGNNQQASTSFVADRVFTQSLPTIGGGVYSTSFPGFQVAEGKGVSSGTRYTFDIAGPLFYFDDYVGNAGVFRPVAQAFAGEASVPQLAVSQQVTVNGTPTTQVRVTSTGPVAGYEFFNYAAAGDHGHNTYTLFGNGTSAGDAAAGVYALPLTVGTSGLATSSTFYILFGKDVAIGSAEMNAAEAAARATLVPEPTTIVAAIAGAAVLVVRRRRAM